VTLELYTNAPRRWECPGMREGTELTRPSALREGTPRPSASLVPAKSYRIGHGQYILKSGVKMREGLARE
jgi:hypothetical protein